MTGVRVTFNDLDALGYCRRGARAFFERHGLNWSLMMQGGVPAEQVEHIDDEMVRAVLREATNRTEREVNGQQ